MVRSQVLSLILAIAMAAGTVCNAQTDQTSSNDQNVVSASSLKRTHAITPTWPESAAGVEGWVRLRFTLLPNGTVTDIAVQEAHPAGLFEASAVDALRQWTFEPVQRDGKKIAQRAEIQMKYALPR